jgi:hypothetical protein
MGHESHKLHHKVYSFPVSLNEFFETNPNLVIYKNYKNIIDIVSEKNHPQVWSCESL